MLRVISTCAVGLVLWLPVRPAPTTYVVLRMVAVDDDTPLAWVTDIVATEMPGCLLWDYEISALSLWVKRYSGPTDVSLLFYSSRTSLPPTCGRRSRVAGLLSLSRLPNSLYGRVPCNHIGCSTYHCSVPTRLKWLATPCILNRSNYVYG